MPAKFRRDRRYKGNTTARGYDQHHKNLRAELDLVVQTGTVRCARCGQLIPPGPWDLGHKPGKRGYAGPEHVRCNRRTSAHKLGDLKVSRAW